ncbi:type 1 periplasmic-binding domain-containing protein [Xinfangfangia pollutisoli]|uniref:hypothetical protein n=1 Tax=Xinfangfangia pollutisoli TaxID=2865960 RepID=UPI001CD1BA78|nr:hypothetical protein [Xinfangfangia pollutisoli]
MITPVDAGQAAVAELQAPGSPYKASVSLASSAFGYAMGQQAADWIEGKSIPKAIDVLPALLTPQSLAGYAADMADPAAVFRDLARRDQYLRFYGNTCADQRAQFVNFPWSSERPRQD